MVGKGGVKRGGGKGGGGWKGGIGEWKLEVVEVSGTEEKRGWRSREKWVGGKNWAVGELLS